MYNLRDAREKAFSIGVYGVGAVLLSTLAMWCAAIVGGLAIALVEGIVIDGSGHPDRKRAAAVAVLDNDPANDWSQAAMEVRPHILPEAPPYSPGPPPAILRRAVNDVPELDPAASFHSGDDETYRTFCVRLCDGYFWPVSFSTTSDRFARDQATCAASCNSPARLFVHRMPGGGPGTMTSLDGLPYPALKTAFLFRTSYDAQCRCQAQPWEQQAQDRHRLLTVTEAARKGDRKAAVEARELTARVEAERQQEARALAVANERASREIAALARSPGARALAAELGDRKRKSQKLAEQRRGGAIMRLGALPEMPSRARWVPASGTGRHWRDRVFNGN